MKDNGHDAQLVVVGIGASAGGLEAFQDLFSRLRAGHKLALVLVQHLAPDHESLLQELLRKRTPTPVHTIRDGMKVEGGNIYLIPPGAALTIHDGTLKLHDFDTPRGQRRPIDEFFESLASDVGENAVAIILSGTGSDGSIGAKAVKAAGGLVLAQDPAQAKYDGMPRSAIATGAVDLTVNTSEMLDVLGDFFDRRTGIEPELRNDRDFLDRVFKHVRYQTGHDFTLYKQSTLMRRLTIRMSVLGINSPAEYVRRLIQERDESQKLIRDVLINVTSFFRDPDVWEVVAREVIPAIIKDKGSKDEVRIWVPGCSTGQEAYSLAILVAEEVARTKADCEVVIFGTDIDDDALGEARRGVYPNSIADEVPKEYLETYFKATQDGYEVVKELRNLVRFSHQSLIKDPPFSKIDMISCRNVTIYFEKALQELAISIFHYSLSRRGYLVLGLSESPQSMLDRFDETDPMHRIYMRDAAPSRPLNLPLGPSRGSQAALEDGRAQKQDSVRSAAVNAIIDRHVPPFMVLSPSNTLIHAANGAEAFLTMKPGDVRYDIFYLIHPALERAVRRVVNHGNLKSPRNVSVDFRGEINGQDRALRVTGDFLENGERLLLFETLDAGAVETVTQTSGTSEEYVRQLETELDDARQTIRTTVEELETSNEELKSSNEEMMSMNEELQSANEELSTINEELQNKVGELNVLNADLNGFVSSTSMATVFLDGDLRVRRFTPFAKRYFRFADNDVGRDLGDITSDIDTAQLLKICRDAMQTRQIVELDMATTDGSVDLIARVVPQTGGAGQDIVFTLIDVTDLRRYARELVEAKSDAQRRLKEVEDLYEVSPIAMALFDQDLKFVRVNERFASINAISAEDHEGRRVHEIDRHLADLITHPMEHVFETAEPVLGLEIRGRTAENPDEDRVWIADWYPLRGDGNEVMAVGVNLRDVSQTVEMQEELRRVMRELQHRVKNMLSNVKALVNRARRDKRDTRDVLKTLSDRIDSLAHTHTLLTAENWQSTKISDLIRPELTDIYGEDVVRTRGPDLRLNSRASLAFGMTIHELATNAAKYGALSTAAGRLDLRWSRVDEGDGDMLRVIWKESGIELDGAPETEGFGSALIQSTVTGSLEGTIEMTWETDGLRCQIDFPYGRATEMDFKDSEQLF